MRRDSVAVTTIDSHVEGEFIRTIVGGLGLRGLTLNNRISFFRKHYDGIRKSLTLEPRGRRGLIYAVLLRKSANIEADVSTFFMYSEGYADVCLVGVMAIAAAVIRRKKGRPRRKEAEVVVETPTGLLHTRSRLQKGVLSVTVENFPAFIYKTALISLPGLGKIPAAIVYVTDFVALIDSKNLGMKLEASELEVVIDKAILIKRVINESFVLKHPLKSRPEPLSGVRIYSDSINKHSSISVTIFGEGNLDRSPCGNGTSAHMAYLFASGKVSLLEEWLHESPLGGKFVSRITQVVRIGENEAYVTEITGRVGTSCKMCQIQQRLFGRGHLLALAGKHSGGRLVWAGGEQRRLWLLSLVLQGQNTEW